MIRFTAIDLQSAIRWLTTTAFEELPFELLAVVLDERNDGSLHQLLEDPDVIDELHFNTEALILSVNDQVSSPQMPFKIRNDKSNQWFQKLHKVISTVDKNTGNHFHTTLQLLNIEPDILPVIYLRFKGLPPMYLPVEDNQKTIDCLIDLFRKAHTLPLSGREITIELIEKQLCRYKMYAIPIPEDTQRLLDKGIAGEMTSCSSHEEWQAFHTLTTGGVTQVQLQHIKHKINKSTQYDKLIADLRPLLPEHLQTRLITTQLAYLLGDYGTVATNIGAIIEGSLAESMTQVLRGDFGIDMPTYFKRYDPNTGSCKIADIEINGFSAVIGDSSEASKIRWKAPMLYEQLRVIPKAATIKTLSVQLPQGGWDSLRTIASEIARIRNPAAHGERLSKTQADSAWTQLQAWYDFGCAQAIFKVQQSIPKWPLIPQNALQQIHEGYLQKREAQQVLAEQWVSQTKTTYTQSPRPLSLIQDTKALQSLQTSLQTFSTCSHPTEFIDLPIDNQLLHQFGDISTMTQDIAQLKGIKKNRKNLRRRLFKSLRVLGTSSELQQTYHDLGSILKNSTDTTDFMIALQQRLNSGSVVYRNDKSKEQLERALQRIAYDIQKLSQYDQVWALNLQQQIVTILSKLELLINKNTLMIQQQEEQHQRASKAQQCASRIHANLLSDRDIVCTCGEHDISLLDNVD